MSLLTITTKSTGVPVDVTSVTLSDKPAAFGIRRVDTGAVLVAAGTAATHAGTGVYTYTYVELSPAVEHEACFAVVSSGVTVYRYVRWTSPITSVGQRPATIDLDLVTMMKDDLLAVIAERGEVGIYRKSDGTTREVHMLLDRGGARIEDKPRNQRRPLLIKVVNDASATYYGIAAAEHKDTDEIDLPVAVGGATIRVRLFRIVEQTDAHVVFEG